MDKGEEIEALHGVIRIGMGLICDAMGREIDDYDRDQADIACYLDCFVDAAKVIEMSGIKFDRDEGEFLAPDSAAVREQAYAEGKAAGQKKAPHAARRVVCAACKVGDLILCGPRHWDSTMRNQAKAIQGHGGWDSKRWNRAEQGFVDQFGVFMDRKEAMQVAKAAGQPIDIERGCGGSETTLYSEGLY